MHGAFQEATLSPIAFWFLRHGETDWNAQGISQGNVDIPLNATGIAQARAAAEKLRNRGIATIVASPLSRARVTAEFVGEALGLPVALDPDLREVSFGVQEGQGDERLVRRLGERRVHAGRRRDLRGFATAARWLRPTARPQQPPAVLVVAHGALFRSLRAAMGIEPNMRTQNAVPIFCEPPAPAQPVWTLQPVV